MNDRIEIKTDYDHIEFVEFLPEGHRIFAVILKISGEELARVRYCIRQNKYVFICNPNHRSKWVGSDLAIISSFLHEVNVSENLEPVV